MLLCLLEIILIETLPVAYSSIPDDYLQPYGDCDWLFFFTVAGVSEDSSMYILHFPAPCNRNAGCLPLYGLISQLLGKCWRAIGIVSRLRSLAFQSAMATSLDETYPRRGTLQIVRWGVRTTGSYTQTVRWQYTHSLTYGGAARNFPSLPIPISAMTVLQYYSCVIGGIEITLLSIQYGSPRR